MAISLEHALREIEQRRGQLLSADTLATAVIAQALMESLAVVAGELQTLSEAIRDLPIKPEVEVLDS